jgi:hypothetical protein
MAGLVVGTFEAENQAAEAVRKLLNSCVRTEHVRTSTLPPRRFATASRRRSVQAHQRPQRGGITVAVRTAGHVAQILALRILREHGARDVGHAPEPVLAPARKALGSGSAQFALPL